MPSQRLPASLEPNALSAELEACALEGRPYIDLTLSNPTRCGFEYSGLDAALALRWAPGYEPDPRGHRDVRAAVAAYHGHGLRAEDLILTASTSEAYAWLFKLLCDPGDQVLVPSPSYPLFHWLAALEGVEARPAPGHLPTALEADGPPCPLFVLSGLSKVAAMPQVKLGWIAARGDRARALLEPLAFIADQYLSVSASAQAVAPELLRLAPVIQAVVGARLRANLADLDRALAPHPHLSRLPVEGGWTVLLRRPALDPGEACAVRLLREARVLVHPGHFFDLPGDGYLVLSLLPRPELFREGLDRALAALVMSEREAQ